MKLRIRGNSIRLRLSQAEVAELESQGGVSDRIGFATGAGLEYRLAVDPRIQTPAVAFEETTITVSLPAAVVRTWLDPSEVSIHGSQSLPGADELTILVEKDFACLQPREGEDQENLFPNPGTGAC